MLLAVALMLAIGVMGQVALARVRPGRTPAVDESFIAALGGFRSLAAEVIWYRADRLQDKGRYGELLQLASLLTWLEPHDAEVWTYTAWNLAYNISVRMPRLEDRWPWVYAGLKLLRDEGLRWNPQDPDICRELAFFFELKIGLPDYDAAAPLYKEEWRKIVEDVRSRGAWNEIGMEPAKMSEIERMFGVTDWTNPFASALYWAVEGSAGADGAKRPYLNEIVRQSRILYDRSKSGVDGEASR